MLTGECWKRACCLALIGWQGCNAKLWWEQEAIPTPLVGEDLAAVSDEKVTGSDRPLNLHILSGIGRDFLQCVCA